MAEGPAGQDDPTDAQLREARWICLAHLPGSRASKALARRVTALMIPHLDHKRLVGSRRRDTLQHNTGILLAGILRPMFRGQIVLIHRSSKAGLWVNSEVGCTAAWRILDALVLADLIGALGGVQTSSMGCDDSIVGGLPTLVWPTPVLTELAERLGLTSATMATDWVTNPQAERRCITVKPDDLIAIHGLQRGEPKLPVPPRHVVEAEAMRFRLVQLNDHVRTVGITGCPAPAFRRVFRANLQLGGRFYAVGGSNYQNMRREDRRSIQIAGEPVVEVGLHAIFLTLLLGLSGTETLPAEDLYSAVGLPRTAVETWILQTFATGNAASRWGEDTAPGTTALAVNPPEVRQAALLTYPALGDLVQIVPADLLNRLPEDRHGWAVSQYFTNLESRVIDGALWHVKTRGGVGLPMHDSIIVPVSAMAAAADGLRRACVEVAQIKPRLTVFARDSEAEAFL